jgi:2-hydroxychromene-2-carboxylate isomerase
VRNWSPSERSRAVTHDSRRCCLCWYFCAPIASLGKGAAAIVVRAKSQEGDRLLKEATGKARELGVFGAPTFAVGQEIFWGDDRLEEAISFASKC